MNEGGVYEYVCVCVYVCNICNMNYILHVILHKLQLKTHVACTHMLEYVAHV